MIVTEGELRLLLGLATAITDEEHAVLQSIHGEAEGLVRAFLGYDPEQRSHTEFYPRHSPAGGVGLSGDTFWDSNPSHTSVRAYTSYGYQGSYNSLGESLQLQHLPVREVTSVHVDYDGKHGKSATAFAAATAWTNGDDFWGEFDEDKTSRSGMLMTNRGWPIEPGTVRVVYTAGYSSAELAGRADVAAQTADALNGIITTPGVSAAGIKRAIIITVTKMMHTWYNFKKSATSGFGGGTTFQSEKFQDYSYSRPTDSSGLLAGLLVGLPSEAEEALESFRHFGVLRL